MTRPWSVVALAAVLAATLGAGSAAAQTVMARHVPAGEQVEVMLNGKPVGSTTADAAGEAKVAFNMRDSLGRTEIDANIYVDRCETTHRIWIVEVGTPAPGPGTCALRAASGVYWVRPVNTIVINDMRAAVPSLLLLKGTYTPPAEGSEASSGRDYDIPGRGIVLFGGAGLTKTTDVTATACGDVSGCTGDEGGFGFAGGGEYRFNAILSAEVSYLRPSAATAAGSGSNYRFDSEQNAHVFKIAGKVGVPAGFAKVYGRGGALYNQSQVVTTQSQDARTITVDGVEQTIPATTQTLELETDGWGWFYGGGLEIWVSPGVAIYGEFDYGQLKGKDVNDGEGRIDNRLVTILGGIRIHLGR